MKDLSEFKRFTVGNTKQKSFDKPNCLNAVIYTRVSSKEQADKNLSLESQKRIIEEAAIRSNFKICGYFGGTYESAKTDGRKEFNRMLTYIKTSKEDIRYILVYSLDRFSRTGAKGAISIASDLREKYGIHIYPVTQPSDTTNASGVLFQNIQLLFSEHDNELRKQRAALGMKEKFKRGIWVVRQPMGYDIIRANGERKIVVNKQGQILKKAFQWKAQGICNNEILLRLKTLGLPIYEQKLSKILHNPFYCGILRHNMLGDEIVEGTHEKLISKELFLKVNAINIKAVGYGVTHNSMNEKLPLKKFIKCSDCGQPFTGYLVKKKNIYYYKCRTKGCRSNRNASTAHSDFQILLSHYQVDKSILEPLKYQMEHYFKEVTKEHAGEETTMKRRLSEIIKAIEKVEERYFVSGDMEKETFEKLTTKLKTEKRSISEQLVRVGSYNSSNLSKYINISMEISSKLPEIWTSSPSETKGKLQSLVFPDGIVYDKVKKGFRTSNVNSVFSLIAELTGDSWQNKKGKVPMKNTLTLSAERGGFEPSVPLLVQQFSRLPHSTALPSLR